MKKFCTKIIIFLLIISMMFIYYPKISVANQTIEDGVYEIETGVDRNKVLDVINAVTYSGGNVQIFARNNQAQCQKVNVKYVGNGYYTLQFLHSKMFLDVANAGQSNGTNVWQCRENGADAQKWIIKEAGNGYYYLISKCNDKYLTVAGGKTSNCTNIEVNSLNSSNAQKFKFNPVNQHETGTKTIEDGLYEIETGVDRNKVLDVINAVTYSGGNVQIFARNDQAKCQKVNVKYVGNGYYTLQFLHSKMFLDVANAGQSNGTNVWQCRENGADAQKWIIREAGNGYYYLISKCNDKYLTVAGGKTSNCTNIEVNALNSSNAQKFKFNKIEKNTISSIDTTKYPGYKEKIQALMDAHPNWNFELLYTGLSLDEVVSGEAKVHSRNLVPSDKSGEWICSVCGTKPYDSGWYCASEKATAYYMDPRNFLDEVNIFQFQDVNEYISGVFTLEGIQNQINNTYLQNYANDIDTACRNKNVNPYYIISRLIQEQGRKGTTIGKGMDGGDGKTYYNPFNIGASGNGWNEIYANALARAKKEGWDTMEKAIEGGITFCKANWLENYQNTLYQNKFDIDTRNGTSLYTHQYMQNLMGAYSEAQLLQGMYANTGKINSYFTFIIPVYENMSSTVSQLPSNSSEIYPMDVETTGTNINVRKEANTNSAVIRTISEKGTKLLSIERGINTNWQKVIFTDGTIGYVSGTYLKQIDDQVNCNIRAKVKTNDGYGCNTRLGPSTSIQKGPYLDEATEVTIINKGTYNNIDGYNWYRIRLSDGRQAFIPGKYLKTL